MTARIDLFGNNLPEDARVAAFSANEGLSVPFLIAVEFTTQDHDFDVEGCLSSRLLLVATSDQGEERCFDGVVRAARLIRVRGETLVFEVELGPAVQALEEREDCRIFQDQSIVDVVKKLFDEAGLTAVEWKLNATYPPRPYIVQYRETTFAFVSRLLENDGIFYFFKHDREGHQMVVTDSIESFSPPDQGPSLSLASVSAGAEPMMAFTRRRTLGTNRVQLRDYDFEKPAVAPESQLPAEDAWLMPYFEYPAGFTADAEGKRLAKVRMYERRVTTDVCQGTSSALALAPGVGFRVEDAGDQNLDGEWVVTALHTTGQQRQQSDDLNWTCSNSFLGIPVGTPYAPPRRTPRPRIRGLQTAIVTGAVNEEEAIHTDSFGRIKVRFYWDRIGQQDDTSSCWMRVAQVQMGGTMILPRLGWEVSVAFLDGDPDRPLVLGRVYNGAQSLPMSLPASKASGCLRSMSSPGGGGQNEISMGDSGGSQGHGMKAQKDLNMATGNNVTEDIAVDDKHVVNVNMLREIGADETVSIGANQTLSVGHNQSTKIASDQSITVGAADKTNATGNYLEKIGGSRNYTVGGNMVVISNAIKKDVQGSFTRKVGAVEVKLAVGSISDNVLGSVSSSVGAVRVHLVNGSHGETVGGAKSETVAAAAAHLTSGNFDSKAAAAKNTTIGGLHFRKVSGDFTVKAPMITIAGGMGQFKGGGSKLSLNGGPVTLKGSKVSGKTAMVKKIGGTMKIG